METADFRDRNDPPGLRKLDWARLRRVLMQSQVRPGPMIVVHKPLKMPVQASFVEHDHVIQALAANGADHPFDIGPLSG